MKTVYVAMSGGVDSSVAAALLKKDGYSVVGVFFKPWQPGMGKHQAPSTKSQSLEIDACDLGFSNLCSWKEDRLDAMRVAAKLGIEFKTWDFSREYGREVAQYMINGYRAGITPNPDVMCNKEIKFGLFLKKALAEGADYIATGHYARVRENPKSLPRRQAGKFQMLKAKDKNKDQTYFLWTLTQEQLQHCLFPIGGYTKPQVRMMAKRFGLPTAEKKDSQGVCFVGELDMHDFLAEYIKPKPGPIYLAVKPLNSESAVSPLQIGTHDGAAYYTIGQRHGLNITIGGGPYYVTQKVGNTLFVSKSKLKSQNAKLAEAHWIIKQQFPLQTTIKIRYRSKEIPAIISEDGTISFQKPATSITPGQSAVFYKGQEVLGGGVLL